MVRPVTQKMRTGTWEEFKDFLHAKLVRVIDPRRVAAITDPQVLARELRLIVERIVDAENPLLNLMERERLIDEILDDAFGYGPLEMLFLDDRVREIRVENPERVMVRRQSRAGASLRQDSGSFEPVDSRFRSLEQLYLICSRLLRGPRQDSVALVQPGEPAVNTAIELEVPPGFLMTARFPPSKMQSPTLHFRRLREPPSPPEIPVSTLPRREQLLLIRFVKLLHEAGFDDLRHLAESIARPIAECVVQDFFAAQNEPGCDVVPQPSRPPEELAPIIESILNEALRGNSP